MQLSSSRETGSISAAPPATSRSPSPHSTNPEILASFTRIFTSFNSMLDSNSETLRRVLKADLHLASFDSSCWSAQVSNAFNGLQSSAMFKQKMLRAVQVPMQEFICDLRFRHLKVWREADFSCPRAVNKKAVTYHKWCGSSESGPRGSPFWNHRPLGLWFLLVGEVDRVCKRATRGT